MSSRRIANTKPYDFAVEHPIQEAQSVRVCRVEEHLHFSRHVIALFEKVRVINDPSAVAASYNNAVLPPVISVCSYSPAYICGPIDEKIQHWHRTRTGDISTQEMDAWNEFKERCSSDKRYDLLSHEANDDYIINGISVKSVFQKATKQIFPHLESFPKTKDQFVRICFFREKFPAFNPSMYEPDARGAYLLMYEENHSPWQNYAFFRWMNGTDNCFVVPPDKWQSWGMPKPRDFAIFQSPAAKVLIEYLPDYNMILQAERSKDSTNPEWQWPFLNVEQLLKELEKSTKALQEGWDATKCLFFTPQMFLERVYSQDGAIASSRTVAEDQIKLLIKKFNEANDQGNLKSLKDFSSRIKNLNEKEILQEIININRDYLKPTKSLLDWNERGELVKKLKSAFGDDCSNVTFLRKLFGRPSK